MMYLGKQRTVLTVSTGQVIWLFSERERVKTNMENKQFTITKKIAKHGNQTIIIVPKMLENQLKSGMLVELAISILETQPKDF